jgi:hypothetical protein
MLQPAPLREAEGKADQAARAGSDDCRGRPGNADAAGPQTCSDDAANRAAGGPVATADMAPAPSADSAKRAATCPSEDFTEFLRAFAESADVQRRFTHLPLIYGKLDLDEDPPEFTKRKIKSFDEIPTRDPAEGIIFPNKNARLEGNYSFVTKNGANAEFHVQKQEQSNVGVGVNGVSVNVFIEETNVTIKISLSQAQPLLGACWDRRHVDLSVVG